MRMEEKPKRRLLTKSTGQADLTGVKRPHRLAFCTSQQREVFSMQNDGSETIQEKLHRSSKHSENCRNSIETIPSFAPASP
ncbi:hypothetical protein [Synechococcus sp. MIT S9508]|uniref:hypothetical protein n=1 Tax=Synechococcus sp. MIT S9508 TaxID=1801629 RepID=UPI0018D46A5E|nr:hypothetical protein [Synechococcus sp. MIT S9508]